MYAMRYGTVPIVRATGGLVDTVENFAEGQGRGNGFRVPGRVRAGAVQHDGLGLRDLLRRPAEFAGLRQRAMAQDFSCAGVRPDYVQTYRWAIGQRTGIRPD